MTPAEFERHADLIRKAKTLSAASEHYFKAARAIEMGDSEDATYLHIKAAKESLEDAFPEIFQARQPANKFMIKEENDHRILKTIGLVTLILGILFAFVKFGPTGDLTKTWTADDIPKATAYPK